MKQPHLKEYSERVAFLRKEWSRLVEVERDNSGFKHNFAHTIFMEQHRSDHGAVDRTIFRCFAILFQYWKFFDKHCWWKPGGHYHAN